MRYWQAYRFIFSSPNWFTNVILGGVCALIPILGPILLIGYSFEIIEVLLRRRQRSYIDSRSHSFVKDERIMDALPIDQDPTFGTYPDFNFNRFTDYLTRGIWPFLVQYLSRFAVSMIGVFFLFVCMILAGFAAQATDSPVLFFAGYGLAWLVFNFLMIVSGILIAPIYVRAGLSRDFANAFSLEFYREFMKRVGKELVLAELFFVITSVPLGILGIMLCFVGFYPIWALLHYVHHLLEFQLYELYLERGGIPVGTKEEAVTVLEEYEDDDRSSTQIKG